MTPQTLFASTSLLFLALAGSATAQSYGSGLKSKLDHMALDAMVLTDELDSIDRALAIVDMASDASLLTALAANHSVWTDGFGVTFDPSTSYFGGIVSTLPGVFALHGADVVSAEQINDFHFFPVPLAADAISPAPPAGLVRAGTWCGSIGESANVVGTATIIDITQLAAANVSDPGLWTVSNFFPLAIVDPMGPVTPAYAAEFLALSASDAFLQPGDILGWLGLDGHLAFPGSVYDSGGGADGLMSSAQAAFCNEAFWECTHNAHQNYRQALASLATDYRAAAIPLEDFVELSTDGPLTHILLGACKGAALGAAAAASAGGAGGIGIPGQGTAHGATLASLFGAAVGASVGLATWAFELDAESHADAKQALEELKELYEQRACDAARTAGAAMKECIHQYCPDLGDDGESIIDAWVAAQGC